MMTETRIAELFSINPTSAEPFRTQLERKLALFINSSAPGTPIPPERILAKCLGISRVTVRNAITPFLTSGRIIRHNRNGTVVAEKQQQEPELNVNELAIGLPWHLAPVVTLKFLCYETLPAQRVFWESVVGEFNAAHTNCQIETVWIDKVLKGQAMRNFITQNGIDIMLHSPMYELPLESLAAELPQDIQDVAEHDQYIFHEIKISEKAQFRRMFPYQIVYSRIFYNNGLAEKCGLKNVSERLFHNDKTGLMREALPKLDKGKTASSHIWCHLAYQGIIPDEKNLPLIMTVLEKLCSVKEFDNAFMLKQEYSLDDAVKFVNGNMLFFNGLSSQLQTVGMPAFNMKQQIAVQLEGTFKFGTPVGIIIAEQCSNREAAGDFIRYLNTDKVQKKVADIKNEFPVKKDLFRYAAEKQCGLDAERADMLLKKTFLFQNTSCDQESAVFFCIFKCRDLLVKMMEGELSAADCAAGILQYWKLFKEGSQTS